MNIGFAIFIIVAALAMGWLYYDKIKECNELRGLIVNEDVAIVMPLGTAIFTRQGHADIAKEVDEVIRCLKERQINMTHRRKQKWGEEVWFDNDYKIFVCNPDIDIPTFKATTLFIGADLSADQVLRIMSQHQNTTVDVHLWTADKV